MTDKAKRIAKSPWIGVALALIALASNYVDRLAAEDAATVRESELENERHALELRARESEGRQIRAAEEERTAIQAVADQCRAETDKLREGLAGHASTLSDQSEALDELSGRIAELEPNKGYGGAVYLVMPPPVRARSKPKRGEQITKSGTVVFSNAPEPVF